MFDNSAHVMMPLVLILTFGLAWIILIGFNLFQLLRGRYCLLDKVHEKRFHLSFGVEYINKVHLNGLFCLGSLSLAGVGRPVPTVLFVEPLLPVARMFD